MKIRFIAIAAAIGMILAIGSTNANPICLQEPATQDQEKSAEALAKQKQEEIFKKVSELGPKTMSAFKEEKYEEAFKHASEICELAPNIIRFQMLKGSVSFAAGKMDDCVAAYDEVIRLQPGSEPQLWQRGLALYYANRFEDGVKQFETHQTVNSQDVENAVWHLLCSAKISNLEEARKKLIPITGDTRIPMSQVYEMFAGRLKAEEVLKAANQTSDRVPAGGLSHRLQLYYAHLYIGLCHEMLGKHELATESIKKAEEVNPIGKLNGRGSIDFMGQVARAHLTVRKTAENSDEK